MEDINKNNLIKKEKNIKNRTNNKINIIIVAIFCIIFFILTSILSYWQKEREFLKFSSPDENANYVFTKLYQETGKLYIFEKYNLIAEDIIRPRSYFSYQGVVKPVSFLGIIIIYGNLAKIFGMGVVPFLTPFFGALGLFFYYLLIKLLFGRKNAIISFFLFFSFPVFLYYSARSMFHNVLFVSFFIMAIYFLFYLFSKHPAKLLNDKINYLKKLFKIDFLYSALSGTFFGLAVSVRASELIWLAPAGLLLLILKWRRVSFFRLSIFICFFFLALMPIFYYNQILYNSPFYGGYNEMNRSIEEISYAGSSLFKSFFSGYLAGAKNYIKVIFNTVFYFGFYPKQSFQMFERYCLTMFWYLFWPFIFGVIYAFGFKRKIIKKIWPYGLSWILLSIILILYYGSWKFVDNPDPNSFTIGNSYTRYWLPIYIGLFPFVAMFILSLVKPFSFLKNKFFYKIISITLPVILVLIIMFISFKFVYSGSEEGLKYYFEKNKFAKNEVNEILNLTENNSIIITEYHDKFLFPERKVVVGRFNDDNMNKNYYKLAKYLPIYYYNFTFPENDLEYLNNRRLKDFGMKIDLIKNINDVFSLYKINNIE